jgi:glycosyltransferase involved in cell wall biosynthesis
MRIGLNLLHALPEIGGGWNYIASLMNALGIHDRQNEYVAFTNSESVRLVPCEPNFRNVPVRFRGASRVQRVLYENTRLHILAKRHRLDVMHWFGANVAVAGGIPSVSTVYDLQAHFNLASHRWSKLLYLRTMLRVTARRARLIVTISDSTANDLQRYYRVALERLLVIPPIVAECFRPASVEEIRRTRETFGLPEHYWLYVAHFYRHKNHERLLGAYARLKSSGAQPWPLVLRGDDQGVRAEVAGAVSALGLSQDVTFLPWLGDGDLRALYSGAGAMVFPSLYEGAGIPVLEAMACGCPIAAARIPAVEEQAVEAALYFDPLDLGSIETQMRKLQGEPELRQKQSQAGVALAGRYRAGPLVGKLVHAYEQVGSQASRPPVRSGSSGATARVSDCRRPSVMAAVVYYLPGFRGGGPTGSVAHLVEWLGAEVEFSIVTRDRDLGGGAPYPGIWRRGWQRVGNARVAYLRPREFWLSRFARILRNEHYNLLYLQGFFSPATISALLLRRLGLLPARPVIVAPRGEFSPGALEFKRRKKHAYLWVVKRIGLYRGVVWQASTEMERAEILAGFGETAATGGGRIAIAPNLPARALLGGVPVTPAPKVAGSARVIFLSRIGRKKGLDVALRILGGVRGKVEFNIYGPIEDRAYWRECEALMRALPPAVRVNYCGEVEPARVIQTFGGHHLFLFPTRGENFGHVIHESLNAGCPVLVSDTTPWRDLDRRGAGWVVPLADVEGFRRTVESVVAMDGATFDKVSRSAHEYGRTIGEDNSRFEANRRMFLEVLERGA